MPDTPEILGIIAGNRSLPLVVARQAREQGVKRIVAVAFENETSRELEPLVDAMVWLRVGQLNKMIAALRGHEVRHCVMAGQIAPGNLFDLRPDLRALKVLMRLPRKNAHSLFTAVAEELARDGVELISATPWLGPLMPGSGVRVGSALSKEEEEDVRFGWRVAKEISRLEIGQSVVVKNGTVLAVEAFEGTDRCLARGGALGGRKGGAVAVKVAKNGHDMRFDIPCVGPKTIETCAEAGIRVLAVEAGKTLVLEEEQVRALVKRHSVTLLTVD